MGDPAGIGPEFAARAVAVPEVRAAIRLVVIGDKRVFDGGAAVAGVDPRTATHDIAGKGVANAGASRSAPVGCRDGAAGELGVKRQEVVAGFLESGHGCDSVDALVWAVPVVVMDPGIELIRAVGGVLVDETVRPFAQG